MNRGFAVGREDALAEDSSHSFPVLTGVNDLELEESPASVLRVKQNEVSLMWWNSSASPVVFQGPESDFLTAWLWQFVKFLAFITISHKQCKTHFACTCGQMGITASKCHKNGLTGWCFHGRAQTELRFSAKAFIFYLLASQWISKGKVWFSWCCWTAGDPSASAKGNEISRVPGDKLGTEGWHCDKGKFWGENSV